VRWLAATVVLSTGLFSTGLFRGAASLALDGSNIASATVPPGGDTVTTGGAGPSSNSSTPATTPSAPLIPIPQGCQASPVASAVFVGRIVAKDYRLARFQIEQVRAGSLGAYALGNLVDIRYGNDVQYLETNSEYLVGASPQGVDLGLTSKVRAAKPVFGGNAVVGLTEKSSQCPVVEDPVRTVHVDGSEVAASVLKGLSAEKKQIGLAFAKPILAVFAIVLLLVLIRWFFTAVFLAFRHAVEKEPSPVRRNE
jgi:hypothetical protein